MDNSLHFIFTGDSEQLLAALQQSKKAMEALEETASKYGMSVDEALKLVSQHMQTSAAGMNDFLKGVQEGAANAAREITGSLSDLSTKTLAWKSELNSLQSELANTSVEDIERINELNKKIDELKANISEAEQQLVQGIEESGVQFTISSGEGATNAGIEDTANQFERLKQEADETTDRFEKMTASIDLTRAAFNELINTGSSASGDMLHLAENNDKIDALNERLHMLSATNDAALESLKSVRDAIEQAVAEGNQEQADELQKTYESIEKNRLEIQQEADELIKTRDKLEQENDEIRSKSQEITSTAAEMPKIAGDSVAPTVEKFAKLKEAMGGVGSGFGQIMGGFKSILGGGASAARGLGMVTTGFKTLYTTAMSNPITAVIAAIVLAVQQLVQAFKRNEEAMAGVKKAVAPFKALWQSIQRLFNNIVTTIMKVANEVKNMAGASKLATLQFAPLAKIIERIRTGFAVLSTILVDFVKGIRTAVNWIDSLRRSLMNAFNNTKLGQWIQGIKDKVLGFFNEIKNWIEKAANTNIGKKLGLDTLYQQIKEIHGAQEELTKNNKKIADLELEIDKKRRANMTANAKIDEEILKLQKEYTEAAGDAVKQQQIAEQISKQEKARRKNELDLAKKELELVKTKYSLLKDTNLLTEIAEKEAEVIRKQAEYDYGMSSQESGTARRVVNDEYRKLKSELDSERDLRLQSYEQQKIDARDNREELKRIEMEEFNYKQTMQKKSLDLQLKYHKISQEDYDLQMRELAAAAATHKKQVEAGDYDYFKNAKLMLKKSVLDKNEDDDKKAEIDALKERLQYETRLSEQLKIRNVIRKKELELQLTQIERDKQNKIRDVYGESGLKQYQEGNLNDVAGVAAAYDAKKAQTIQKSEQEGEQEAMASGLKAYEEYYKERLRIANEYSQKVNAVVNNADMPSDQANSVLQAALQDRNDKQKRLEEKYAGTVGEDDSKLIEDIVRLETSITMGALDEARSLYDQLLTEIDSKIKEKDENIANLQANLDELNNIEEQLKTGKKQVFNEETGEMESVDLTDEDRLALEERKQELLMGQADATAARVEYERQITAEVTARGEMDEARGEVEEQRDEMVQKQAELSQQRVERMVQTTQKLATMFGNVSKAAKKIGDTFGGVLTKNGKKVLNAISGIGDVAKDSLNMIAALIPKMNGLFTATKVQANEAQAEMTATSTTGQIAMTTTEVAMAATMTATSTAAAEAIKNVERASVILAIISAVIQIIMAIVSALKSVIKTQAEEIQENIDKHKERLEELKKLHEKLEREYKNSVGIDYYKGMAAAAKDYERIIKESNEAIRAAQELYEYNLKKYGEDSDKTKDAKEQWQELERDGWDYIDSQKEMYDELVESLVGTNVTSFAENLADQLVDAWLDGTSDMEDIWDNMLDNMQRDMMKKGLSIALTDMFESTFQRISDLAKNGELTQSEIDTAIAEIDAKSAEAQAIAEQWRQAMAERGLLDEGDVEGSKGFGQMTQDQADTLTARFTALQMEGANVVAVAQLLLETITNMQYNSERQTTILQSIDQYQQLAFMQAQENADQLKIIADNTSLLAETNSRLRSIEQNTDKL